MISSKELQMLREIPMDLVDIQDIPDLRDIHIDTALPKEERLKTMLNQGFNPYLVRVGDMKIKISYANNGRELNELLKNMVETAV